MDIAVIGMAGRFPLSDSVNEFYKNLRSGKHCVRDLSSKRKIDTSIPNLDYQPMGFLEDIDKFDHEFFKISRREAEFMNPQQRLIMEVVYNLVEDAGYSPAELNATATNIYMSNSEFEYHNLSGTVDATSITGNSPSTAAGRVSRFFDLRGSSVNVDTGCSSSLVAVHLACRDLSTGESDAAIICGCSINIFPALKKMEIDTGITASDGRVKAFAKDADGTISGEAVVAIMIKPLDHAIRDQDHIYAVIKGSAVNHNGSRASFLTAPSSIAQAEVIRKAWQNAHVSNVEDISYIEAHGTGTKIGDPIEVEGLRLAFREYTAARQFCAISSVKTNVGHTDKAAGLTGFVKAVLALANKINFASLNFDEPNPLIDFEASPLYVNTKAAEWKVSHGQIRYAGVSSFGISGTNAHVVLCKTTESPADITISEAMPFIISGKTRQALRRNIGATVTFLKENPDTHLASLSFTLNNGRHHHEFRWGMISDNLIGLIESMEDVLATGADESIQRALPANVVLLQNGEKNDVEKLEVISALLNEMGVQFATERRGESYGQEKVVFVDTFTGNKLALLVDLATSGVNVHWRSYYKEYHNARRISLPGYQFEKVRCWLREPGIAGESQVNDWLYTTTWKKTGIGPKVSANRTILIFLNTNAFSDELLTHLRESNPVINVILSDRYAQIDDYTYSIDVED